MKTDLCSPSVRICNMKPSITLALQAKVCAAVKQGRKLYSLAVGETDQPSPDFVVEACQKALAEGKTRYIPSDGLPELRDAIANFYAKERDFKTSKPRSLVITPGAKFAIYATVLALCEPGDEVLLPAPYWVSYSEIITLAGACAKVLPTVLSEGFKISAERLREAIGPKTKLILLSNPCNPSGTIYSKKEWGELLKVITENNIYLLCDEIYDALIYEPEEKFFSPGSVEGLSDRIITVSGFSKAFSMTGWRLGWVYGPKLVVDIVATIQSHTTSNATSFAQYGALEIFKQEKLAEQYKKTLVKILARRRKKLMRALDGIKGVVYQKPSGAFYIFPDIGSFGLDSTRFGERLLNEHEVVVVPGIDFGNDRCVRVSFSVADNVLEEASARLRLFCEKL